jgi:hypothetical protein
MPFYGHTGIPDPVVPGRTVPGKIRSWSVSEGEFVQPDQRIGMVEVHGESYGLVICFPAMIDRLHAAAGTGVRTEEHILKWIAEGDEIPYGRAYFRLVSMGT